MKRRFNTVVIGCLFLCCHSSLAQQQAEIDSLSSLSRQLPDDTVKILTFHRLSYLYNYVQFRPDEARSYADSAIILAKGINYQKGIIESHYNLGLTDMNEDQYSEAVDHFLQFIDYYTKRGDSLSVARGLYCIATIHANQGNDDSNLSLQLRILKIYEQTGDQNRSANTLNSIGNIYWRTGKYREALESYNTANDLYRQLGKMARYGMGVQNVANVFVSMKEYDTAKVLYEEALKTVKQHGSPTETAFILANLGDLYEELGKFERALDYNLQALNIRRTLTNKRNLAATLLDAGHLYTLLNKLELAQSLLTEGLDLAVTIQAKPLMADGYMNLSELYRARKDYEKAYAHHVLAKQWQDSVSSSENREQINKLQALYETEKKDKQILSLANEKELQKQEAQWQATMKMIYLIGLILVAISAALIIYVFRQRMYNQRVVSEKDAKIREITFSNRIAELEIKALRAQINPHFLFNCLNSINRMVVKGENEMASAYLRKFSRLVRLIVENLENGKVTLENELALIESYIQLEELRFKGRISYEIDVDESVEKESIHLPPMVLQPFVENAIWHGLMHKPGPGCLRIGIREMKDMLLCTIEDNGVGREKAKELQQVDNNNKQKSLGLSITEERLRLLAREGMDELIRVVDLKDNGMATGTRVEICIPVS